MNDVYWCKYIVFLCYSVTCISYINFDPKDEVSGTVKWDWPTYDFILFYMIGFIILTYIEGLNEKSIILFPIWVPVAYNIVKPNLVHPSPINVVATNWLLFWESNTVNLNIFSHALTNYYYNLYLPLYVLNHYINY